MRKFFSTKNALILLTSFAWLIVLLLSTDVGQSLAKDGAIDSQARGAVIVYWALACLLILFASAMRKGRKEAVLMLISLIAALGFAEVLLRTFQLFPSQTMLPQYGLRSSRYHHVLPPNKSMTSGPIDHEYYIVSTNEDGFRTHYTLEGFKQSDVRIAILGDSFTFGIGVADDQTFPAMLERYLKGHVPKQKIAVLNTGLSSYSPVVEKSVYLGKVRKYHPQMVILMLDATDMGDDIIYCRERSQFGDSLYFARDDPDTVRYFGAIAQLLRTNLTYPFVFFPKKKEISHMKSASKRNYNYYEFDLDIGGIHETNRFFIYRHPLDETRPYFESTFATIRQLADSVHSDGAVFILVVAPRYHHWNFHECPEDAQRPKYKVDESYQFEYFKFFDMMKDSAAFPIFNMLPAFQATRIFPLVFRDDAHWNAEGNKFVGRTLADYLITNGYVHIRQP